ncbi:hypothetical protein P171DRAFT_433042 [Karstenula rhodostoma CBS 690.94]|uniref:Uncharacterized protein n=1 Tax=Karstenula rhodostoma CBS 690.94 TaxID=1392251 RepID=A0A9P4U9W9_9PLEO|nr:hypothetical protein P171DRAFT_433042 [Karstenula rhodostoma CBS 690.94]
MLDSASASTIVLLAAASTLLVAAMLYPTSLLRWLQRKRYQYEVTFSLYMLTSTEKFILNSALFLLLSLFIIAASLYLPEHIAFMANRMFYYFSGDSSHFTTQAAPKAEFATAAVTQMLGGGDALRGPAAGHEL